MDQPAHAMTPSESPRLPPRLVRELNLLVHQRARAELRMVWRRHQLALHAAAVDLLIAGRTPEAVLRELGETR